MCAFAECGCGIALVRGVIIVNTFDNSLPEVFRQFLRCPEQALCIALLYEYSRDLACFGGNFEGSSAVSVILLQEFNITVSIDQQEADVGSFTGLVGNSGGSCGLGLRSVNVRNLDLFLRAVTILVSVVQIGVAVGGQSGVSHEAAFCGIHDHVILQRVGIGAEHCAVLDVPGQLVDVAGFVADNIIAAIFVTSGINQFHSYRDFLCGGTAFGDLPSLNSVPDFCAGGVVNDLQSGCVQICPLGHVVGHYNIIEGSLCQVGQSVFDGRQHAFNTVTLNEFNLRVGNAGLHPCGSSIGINQIHCFHVCHCSQLFCCSGCAVNTIGIGYIRALVGSIVEYILNIGAHFFVVLHKCALNNGYGVFYAHMQTGVCVYILINLVCKCNELFVGNTTAKCIVQKCLLVGHTVETVAEDAECCRQVGAVHNSLFKCYLGNSQCAILGSKGLPIEELSCGFVGVCFAVRNVNNMNLVQTIVVVLNVIFNAGKANFVVGGGAAVQQGTGKIAQSCCQCVCILYVFQNDVVAHAECHQSQLSVAVAVQHGFTNSVDNIHHCGPFVIAGVGTVNHHDDFVMEFGAVNTGNAHFDFEAVVVTIDQSGFLVSGRLLGLDFGRGGFLGLEGFLYSEAGVNRLGYVNINHAFHHGNHGLRSIGTTLRGEDVCVLFQLLLACDVQAEVEFLACLQSQTVQSINAVNGNQCTFTGKRFGNGLGFAVSVGISQVNIQHIAFSNRKVCVEAQLCIVNVSDDFFAQSQNHIFREGLVSDHNRGCFCGLSHQILVQSAGSCCAFKVICAVAGVAHSGACVRQITNYHTGGAVQSCIGTICPGPDCALHCVQSFAFSQTVNDFRSQGDILGQSGVNIGSVGIVFLCVCYDYVAICILACNAVLDCLSNLSAVAEVDGVFGLHRTTGSCCLQGCLQRGQAAGFAFCSAPVAVEDDATYVVFCFLGCVVVIVFQICQCIPVAGFCTGFQVDTVTIEGITCCVLQQELHRTGTGTLVIRTFETGGGLQINGQGSAVAVLQFLDRAILVINNTDVADIVTTVVSGADILEGVAFGRTGNSYGSRVGEVTVVGVQITDLALCSLVRGAVAVKLQCRLRSSQHSRGSLVRSGNNFRGGCAYLTGQLATVYFEVCAFICGFTGNQLHGDFRVLGSRFFRSKSRNTHHAQQHADRQQPYCQFLHSLCHNFVLLPYLKAKSKYWRPGCHNISVLGPIALRPTLSDGLPFSCISEDIHSDTFPSELPHNRPQFLMAAIQRTKVPL